MQKNKFGKIEMIGKRFGKLVVIEESAVRNPYASKAYWVCKCDCGNITKPILGTALRNGNTKSCGCFKTEQIRKSNTRHGGCGDRLYSVWNAMNNRCINPKNTHYKYYGGRGITVCDEWQNSFEAFRVWAIKSGYDYNAKYGECTLDRIDVNGNYCPENCRWATGREQSNNKRNNLLIEIDGRELTSTQWADECGVSSATIRYRYKNGVRGVDLIRNGRKR